MKIIGAYKGAINGGIIKIMGLWEDEERIFS
jgi:hypothetical protein